MHTYVTSLVVVSLDNSLNGYAGRMVINLPDKLKHTTVYKAPVTCKGYIFLEHGATLPEMHRWLTIE